MPGMSTGLARAHRQITLTASQDTASLSWPNGYQPGWEGLGFVKHRFQVRSSGTVTTPSITFYGTLDKNTARGSAGLWFVLNAPAEQSGTGSVVNPITATDGSQVMEFSGALEAFRITTNAYTGGGSVIIDWYATP